MSSQFARLRGALDRVGTTTPGTIVGVFAEDLTAILDSYVTTVREAAELKAARAQPAITSESGNQAAQGASAITSVEVPRLTRPEQDALYRETSKRVAQLEAENRYEFASWFFIAVELIEAALIAKWSKT